MDDAELADTLREFLARFADAVTTEPARAANALGDDLGTRNDLSGSQTRALVELVRDGTVARILAGQPLGALRSDTSVDEESRHWALGQWAGAVPSTLPPPDPAPLPPTDPPTAPLPDRLTPTAPDAMTFGPEPVAPSRPPTVVTDTSDRHRRRWPLVLAVVAVGAVLLGAIGAIVVLRDGGVDARTTDVGVISNDGVDFEPISVSDGVTAKRQWDVEGTELLGATTLTNETDAELIVVYDEVVPKDVAGTVDDVTFDPEPDEVVEADPIVRYRTTLAPGATFALSYDATLEDEPTLDELEAWANSWQQAYDDHLADPERSPADADGDGVPDGQDDCDDQAAPDAANGCADADGDGFVDDGTDLCPTEAGTLDGCLDADADGFPDGSGDVCPGETGTLDGCLDEDVDAVPDLHGDQCPGETGTLDGCVDADNDGFADNNGADVCPGIPGTATGCPDRDGDGVTDVLDACPDTGAPGSPSGCPDSDGDGAPDDTDRCPTDAGPVGGCPDSDGDGVANLDDKCPNDKGSPPNGCPDRDGDGVLDGQDKCPDRSGSRSFAGCPAPAASISGPNQLSGTNAGTYRANVTNGTFIAWDDGSTNNPEEYGFYDPCNGTSFTLYFTYRSLDGQVLRSSVLTVTHIRVC